MRYYTINITNPTTGAIVKQWSSIVNGYTDPGAHQIEFEIFAAPFSQPVGDLASTLKIRGPALQDLYSSSFLGMNLDLYAGMSKGLPLANPTQQGALIKDGTIWQSYGNWIGTDMTLDFVVLALGNSNAKPANLVFDWTAGTPLSYAISASLTTAYPNLKQSITISPNIVLAHDEKGVYETLSQFARYLEGITVGLFGTNYIGVQIVLQQDRFVVYDNSGQSNPIQIAFTDLVGQPTWVSSNIVQITTVMRGDIQAGNYVQLPQGILGQPGFVITVPQSQSQARSQSGFQGPLYVQQIRHIGSFRDPAGTSWVSVFNCAITNPS